MIIFFDIETVFKYEKTGEKEAKEIDKALEKYGEGFNFMPEFNKILTITVGIKTAEGVKIENLEGSEEEQIKKFFDILDKVYTVKRDGKDVKIAPKLCGHNIKNFDIPFIVKRAMGYGIKLPDRLKAFGKKPWEMDHFIDLYEAYNYLAFRGKGSLDLICNHLEIPTPKQGIDGSEVQAYHDQGKDKEILEYCKRDVEATIAVYDKFVDLNFI
jgi:predicted PolB exonuclease-like 3'-5' exonuclease